MGFDEGAVMIKIGREEPVASMDAAGKIIWARHNDIQTVNIRALGADAEEVVFLIGTHLSLLFACSACSCIVPMACSGRLCTGKQVLASKNLLSKWT